MTQFFTIDRANERLPAVRELLLRLRSDRSDLVALRDRYVALRSPDTGVETPPREAGHRRNVSPSGEPGPAAAIAESRRVRLRIKGIVDQMGATVASIDEWGITLRDIESGLIDFPALVSGRQVWLCWRLGEGDVEWWHELETGIAGRRPLVELPALARQQ